VQQAFDELKAKKTYAIPVKESRQGNHCPDQAAEPVDGYISVSGTRDQCEARPMVRPTR